MYLRSPPTNKKWRFTLHVIIEAIPMQALKIKDYILTQQNQEPKTSQSYTLNVCRQYHVSNKINKVIFFASLCYPATNKIKIQHFMPKPGIHFQIRSFMLIVCSSNQMVGVFFHHAQQLIPANPNKFKKEMMTPRVECSAGNFAVCQLLLSDSSK